MHQRKTTTDPSFFWQTAANVTTIALVSCLLLVVSAAWPEWNARLIEPAASIGTAVAAGFGAWAAWRGVNTWRKQLRGTAHFEASKKLLTAALNLRESVLDARRWDVDLVESDAAAEAHRRKFRLPATEELGLLYLYRIAQWERSEKAVAVAIEADSAAVEAEVLLGKEVQEAMSELRRCVMKLRHELWHFLTTHDPCSAEPFPESFIEERRDLDEAVAKLHNLTDRYLQDGRLW